MIGSVEDGVAYIEMRPRRIKFDELNGFENPTIVEKMIARCSDEEDDAEDDEGNDLGPNANNPVIDDDL